MCVRDGIFLDLFWDFVHLYSLGLFLWVTIDNPVHIILLPYIIFTVLVLEPTLLSKLIIKWDNGFVS